MGMLYWICYCTTEGVLNGVHRLDCRICGCRRGTYPKPDKK